MRVVERVSPQAYDARETYSCANGLFGGRCVGSARLGHRQMAFIAAMIGMDRRRARQGPLASLPGSAWEGRVRAAGEALSKENTMIAKLEQFVRRLVEDQAFRETATRDPEGGVARIGLVGPERHGALKLCAQTAGSTVVGPLGVWV